MAFEKGVHRLDDRTVEQVIEDLSREGWKVFVLHGAEIVDQRSMWAISNRDLVLAPPLGEGGPEGSGRWDAFVDSVTSGLEFVESDRVAIVWRDSEVLRHRSPQVYDKAVDFLEDATRIACNPEYNAEDALHDLCVILA